MAFLIGIVGKPNSGKSSFFKAATLVDVKIAPYPFTTIEPNQGIAYATAPCVGRDFNVRCKPRSYMCNGSTHLIPIELLDVAGLVPGSHAGRGKGNQFLNDLIRGEALIHVVDASGTTDAEGNPTSGRDPAEDVKFLEEEIDLWFSEVIKRNVSKIADRNKAAEVLAGLGIKPRHAAAAIEKVGLAPERLAKELRLLSKPIIIAANKIDLPAAEANLVRIRERFLEKPSAAAEGAAKIKIVPCCAPCEIALRQAAKIGAIEYVPGASSFEIKAAEKLSAEQSRALAFIKERILQKFGSTGIQQCLNSAVFDVLKYIPVYPVENETRLVDKTGAVLPDVHLMPQGSTALDLAAEVHTDLAKNFIRAIDCRTKKVLGRDYVLKAGDVIKIVAKV